MTERADIIVIGSGIAGSIVALVLRRLGFSVLVLERHSHPRFAIGESTTPMTSLLLNSLARTYAIPELAEVAHYLGLKTKGCVAWPKQGFWHGIHTKGCELPQRHELFLEALLLPFGPDVHMLRADVDGYLVSLFEKYGVRYRDRTEVTAFTKSSSGVRLTVRDAESEREVAGRFVVDASGHASFLARQFDMRHAEPRLKSNTRTIFGHFADVPQLDDVLGQHQLFRLRRNAGTMHHCFPGGWAWVIPFDNEITSVGFQFDRRMYPLDTQVAPEQELQTFIAQYPSLQAHLGGMRPVRQLVRTDRVQFTSRTILGDGFILTPHASAFVEPLFASGILFTLAFAVRFARQLSSSQQTGSWQASEFRHIERAFFAEVEHLDHIVDSCIQAGRSYEVYKQCWRAWVVATLAQFSLGLLTDGGPDQAPMLYGAALTGYPDTLRKVHQLASDATADDRRVAQAIKDLVEPYYARICATFPESDEWEVESGKACSPYGSGDRDQLLAWFESLSLEEYRDLGPRVQLENARAWLDSAPEKLAALRAAYAESRRSDSEFHRALDRVLSQAIPGRLDYSARVGLG